MDGYGFTYYPGETNNSDGAAAQQPTQLFAWQVCLVHVDKGALEDADNYPDYLINRARITQALGLGMAQGNNAFPLDGQLFAAAVSIQDDQGNIQIINESHPRYTDVAVIVAEQLLRGEDHGMVAQLPNGSLVPFMPPTDDSKL